ncbi:MAG: helix-turn-helix transcriptional regulator [bacterium]
MNKNTNIMLKLGNKIRIERKKLKLSQEKLAELADLNKNFIGMIERGETNVTVKNLENIAIAIGIDIKNLFDFTL